MFRLAASSGFPTFIATNREASVKKLVVWQSVGESRSWDVQFQRDFNNWKVALVGAFLQMRMWIG